MPGHQVTRQPWAQCAEGLRCRAILVEEGDESRAVLLVSSELACACVKDLEYHGRGHSHGRSSSAQIMHGPCSLYAPARCT